MAYSNKPKLLQLVSIRIRSLHYALQTERVYIHWIRRFIYFNDIKHPKDLGPVEVNNFLSHLAILARYAALWQTKIQDGPRSIL